MPSSSRGSLKAVPIWLIISLSSVREKVFQPGVLLLHFWKTKTFHHFEELYINALENKLIVFKYSKFFKKYKIYKQTLSDWFKSHLNNRFLDNLNFTKRKKGRKHLQLRSSSFISNHLDKRYSSKIFTLTVAIFSSCPSS